MDVANIHVNDDDADDGIFDDTLSRAVADLVYG